MKQSLQKSEYGRFFMTRLKEVITTRRMAMGSEPVVNYARRLETLGVEPATQTAAIDVFVAGVVQQFEPLGNLVLSQRAADIITRAQEAGVDPCPTAIAAAEAALREGRKKIANCGGARGPLAALEDRLVTVLFDRSQQKKRGIKPLKSSNDTQGFPSPTISPDETYARKQRDRVIIAAELMARGATPEEIDLALRRMHENGKENIKGGNKKK